MKTREEKSDDYEKSVRCIKLIQELIAMNPHMDPNQWIAGMMSCIFDGFANSRASFEIFQEYLFHHILHYKEISKEWDTHGT